MSSNASAERENAGTLCSLAYTSISENVLTTSTSYLLRKLILEPVNIYDSNIYKYLQAVSYFSKKFRQKYVKRS